MRNITKSYLIRFEDRLRRLWEAGKIRCPLHLSGGNEEQLLEIFRSVEEKDYVFSGHRNHYHALLKGVPAVRILREVLRREDGLCRGRAGSMNITSHEHKFYTSAILGGICGIAVGVAWALKEARRARTTQIRGIVEGGWELGELSNKRAKEEGSWVWCFVGDSVAETGHFYEALTYAEGWELPVTFVIEDNNRATCTPNVVRNQGNIPRLYKDTGSERVRYYEYTSKFPHVGSGTYVAF